MIWNWQQADWPNFSWDRDTLAAAERQFLVGGGVLLGSVKHLPHEYRDQLIVEMMSTEAVTTSEIEGEILDRISVQSSIQRQLGLAAAGRLGRPAEQGIAEMMVTLHKKYNAPLSQETLFAWHRLLFNGRRELSDIGRHRTSRQPMQIISGPSHHPKVHFEAPPSSHVNSEIRRLIDWFNKTGPRAESPLPALTRAGIAHLYFESIHPFEDGNGRIGRAISEKSLAQSLGQPALTGLAATILSRRKRYYAALAAASRSNEVTPWLTWFAETTLAAQQSAISEVGFVIEKTKLLDRLKGKINQRQEKVLLRILQAGPAGFEGGLSARNYSTIAGSSPATTTRDLAELMDQEVLMRTGERRYARYHLKFAKS